MAFSYGWRGPNIVKDGLSLYVDPGSPNSYYNKEGTAIKDISGNNFTGSLINGPIYSTNGSGSIIFDNTDDILSTNHRFSGDLTGLTVSTWLLHTTTANGNETVITQGGPPAGNQTTFYLIIPNANRYPQFATVNASGTTEFIQGTTFILSDNTWNNISFVCDSTSIKYYANGNYISSASRSGTIRKSPSNFSTTIGANTYGTQVYKGNISATNIYTKALSASEILQNFNATKTRFGL